MIMQKLRDKSTAWKSIICVVLCFLAMIFASSAAAAEDKVETVITLTAASAEMVQEGEIPALTAKAVLKGDKNLVLNKKKNYTVQNLLDSLNRGENYKVFCKTDGKKDGKFPIEVDLSEKLKDDLSINWSDKVVIETKSGTLHVKNKFGDWEGKKFKKADGTYATGWMNVAGNKYYFDKEGNPLTGKQQIGTKKCIFAKDGKLKSEKEFIDPNKPMLALTFDDGPGAGTGRILDVLETYGAKATFFMLGEKVVKYPETVKKIQELGCELGNHTTTHVDLTNLSPEEIQKELGTTSKAVSEATGGHTTTVMRPPFGSLDDSVKANAGHPVIMWSLDTLDWKTRNVQSTIDAVINSSKDGDIVLMHDIHKQSVEAAVQLIPLLVEKGYQLVTVSEMAEIRGIKMDNGVKYFNFSK